MRRNALPDSNSPLVFDTHDLVRQPGTMRPLNLTVKTPRDLGTTVIGIPADSDLNLDLRLESVLEGVLVSGTVRATAIGECVRCLAEVTLPFNATVSELYLYPERAKAAADSGDEDEDLRQLQDELIDFEEALIDSVVPALPFQPLCDEDCPGLCSECGVRLVDEPDHQHEVLDPRWAALQNMLNETKES